MGTICFWGHGGGLKYFNFQTRSKICGVADSLVWPTGLWDTMSYSPLLRHDL